jgi:hypothetical protein
MKQLRFASFILLIACSVTAAAQSKLSIKESSPAVSYFTFIPELYSVNFNEIKLNRFSEHYFSSESLTGEQKGNYLLDPKSTSAISNDFLKTLNGQFYGLEIPKACLIVYDRSKRK